MPSIDPMTGEVLPDPIAPVAPNYQQLPPMPQPMQAPSYQQFPLPPTPQTPQEQIQKMGVFEAAMNALGAFGAGVTGQPGPQDRMLKQYQAEMEPWRVKADMIGKQQQQMYDTTSRGAIQEQEFKWRDRDRQLAEAGLDERQRKDLLAHERTQSKELAYRTGRDTALDESRNRDQAITLIASDNPNTQMQGWALAEKDRVLGETARDPQRRETLAKFAQVFTKNKLSYAEAETAKNEAQASLAKEQLKLMELVRNGKKLSPSQEIIAGLRDKMPNMSPLDSLKYSKITAMMNTGTPEEQAAATEMFTNGLMGVDPKTSLLYKFYAETKDWGKAAEKLANISGADLDALNTTLKILQTTDTTKMSDAEKRISNAMIKVVMRKIMEKSGIDVGEMEKASKTAIERELEAASKLLGAKWGLSD
jgi:hypothetical protein